MHIGIKMLFTDMLIVIRGNSRSMKQYNKNIIFDLQVENIQY